MQLKHSGKVVHIKLGKPEVKKLEAARELLVAIAMLPCHGATSAKVAANAILTTMLDLNPQLTLPLDNPVVTADTTQQMSPPPLVG
jgi:hypothetical protein